MVPSVTISGGPCNLILPDSSFSQFLRYLKVGQPCIAQLCFWDRWEEAIKSLQGFLTRQWAGQGRGCAKTWQREGGLWSTAG